MNPRHRRLVIPLAVESVKGLKPGSIKVTYSASVSEGGQVLAEAAVSD